MICDLCGYQILAELGDFYVAISDKPGKFVHSISCGPPFNGMSRRVESPPA